MQPTANPKSQGQVHLLRPNWPAPATIHAFCTTRTGGYSNPPFDSFNLANHVGDDPGNVLKNRELLMQTARLPSEPKWLKQVHGNDVVAAENVLSDTTPADAVYTTETETVCAVMTADCLPILLCDDAGSVIAAIHAGWRSLAAGIIENTVAKLQVEMRGSKLLVWLAPRNGKNAYTVRSDVKLQFAKLDQQFEQAFTAINAEQWLLDLGLIAKQKLAKLGVYEIYDSEQCAYSDTEQFYSYRRDGETGRFASVIWLEI